MIYSINIKKSTVTQLVKKFTAFIETQAPLPFSIPHFTPPKTCSWCGTYLCRGKTLPFKV